MREITGRTQLVGVIGWPVEHSLSPAMHNAALAAMGLDMVYIAMPVKPADLPALVAGLRAAQFVGFNATIPHKQALLGLVDEVSSGAQAIGAINTVHYTKGGHATGHNTDLLGYTRTVQAESRFRFARQIVLQLGCGGVGRAMCAGAAEAGAKEVLLHARRPEAAAHIAAEFAALYPATRFTPLAADDELPAAAARASLIANATPLGMKPGDPLPLPAELITPQHTVFDTVYTPARTALIEAAERRGAATVGGLGMLARQGAASLAIWTGREPDEDLMLRVLRERIASRG